MKHLQAATYSLALAPITAATTARTANIDTQGSDYAVIGVILGQELNTNSTNVAIQLLESDTTTVTNFATFNSAFNVTIDNTAAVQRTLEVDLKGRKRYLRIAVTPDTTTNGPVLSSVYVALDKKVDTTDSNAIVG